MKTVNTEKKWRKRTNSGWERSRCTDESLNSAPVTKTVASVTSIRSEERCDGDVDDEATIAALQRLEPEPELEMGSTSEWMGEEEGTREGEEGEAERGRGLISECTGSESRWLTEMCGDGCERGASRAAASDESASSSEEEVRGVKRASGAGEATGGGDAGEISVGTGFGGESIAAAEGIEVAVGEEKGVEEGETGGGGEGVDGEASGKMEASVVMGSVSTKAWVRALKSWGEEGGSSTAASSASASSEKMGEALQMWALRFNVARLLRSPCFGGGNNCSSREA